MSNETEFDTPVADEEASEAQGVAEFEMATGPLSPEEAAQLDGQTLEGIDEDERRAVEEANVEFEAVPGGGTALSKNFTLGEFHCCRGHCAAANVPGDAVPALRRLVKKALQPMRDKFGVCTVHSGYRNQRHNQHVGGVTNSFHRYDLNPSAPAADVSFANGTVDQWAAEARRLLPNTGGIGRYPSQRFVHVDLGPRRQWNG